MKNLLLLLLLLLSVGSKSVNAQSWEWAKCADSSNNCLANAVATDVFGHVYVAGTFSSASLNLGSTPLDGVGSNNMYLAKYDTSGSFLWAIEASCDESLGPTCITADTYGNIYVCGAFSGQMLNFDTFILYNSYIGINEVFIAKYDSSGHFLWAKSGLGSQWNQAFSIATDLNGNVYMTGYFGYPSIAFDALTLHNVGTPSNATNNTFLVKYDSNGNVIWGKSAGGRWWDYADAVTVDLSNNVYITGVYGNETMYFDTIALSGPDIQYVFVAKYDSTGRVLWAKKSSGCASVQSLAVKTDQSKNAYIAGNFFADTSLSFGNDTLREARIGSNFITKFDSIGRSIWVKGVGVSSSGNLNTMNVDLAGNIYTLGIFQGWEDSDIVFGADTLKSIGNSDIFLAKFDSSGYFISAKVTGYSNYGVWTSSIATDLSGNAYIAGSFVNANLPFGNDTLICGSMNIYNMYLVKYFDPISYVPNITKSDNVINIYPNPTTSTLTINSSQAITEITITNLVGQVITSSNVNQKEVQVDVSYLPTGMYFLIVNGTEVKRFLKE